MAPSPSFFLKGNKIGKKLMVLIIAFSSFITFFITGIQLFVDYQQQLNDLDDTLKSVSVNVPTISSSVWAFDEEQIKLSLEALENLRNIEYVEITTDTNQKKWRVGTQTSRDVLIQEYPLQYTKRDDILTIATLKVVASLDAIYERVLSKALGILLSNAIKTFCVALFMFGVFYKLIARRIIDLANRVEDLGSDISEVNKSDRATILDEDDEIDIVQKNFDHMEQKLRRTVNDLQDSNKKLQHAYEEVQTINSELEARVYERTQHLQQEIIEREYVQESLKSSEQRLRDIAEAASDWFWEVDPQGRFTYLSGRCYEVTGLKPEDVIGKSRMEISTRGDLNEEHEKWQLYEEIIKNELKLENFQYHLNAPNGNTMIVELNGKPFYDANGTFLGYHGAARDITEQIIYQEKLEEAKKLADIANSAKSEFISSMSHELRTPLNGILGFAQLLEMNTKKVLDETQAKYVQQILGAGNHLLILINDILDLAKVEAGKVQLSLEPISPSAVILDKVQILQPLAEKYQVDIITDFSAIDAGVQLSVDMTRFSQIIMNLCSNAIKYNRKDGKVFITMERTKNNWLKINFKDTGQGIASDQMEDLFTPFNRLAAEGSETEGTGVGLSITRRLVELMAGRIGVESEVGKGSTFWIEFKILHKTKTPSTGTIQYQRHVTDEQLLPCRVLYVEDNKENMKLLSDIFNQFEGVELVQAETAEDAIPIAVGDTALDLILMDLNLPGQDGFSALKELRRHSECDGIPVIALSANVRPEIIERARKEGFKDFITKPINIVNLIKTINGCLKKQQETSHETE
jgi:PAS domain S-box-containing protein